ncbi:succinyl-diaminopimelate desuccinylase [Companilactobacillus paralimentarius DSM 13238 = JCM 10415]|uniref:Probable succinyl-diaminopimelate desuccinylase n=1 Tax=Companilactobacillus paralimentarius DSM 13238 = JCM 10415 TaxID=1122151 RepID=A0A0R1PDS3_9LACO|nr:ArgE/DapE family deacylase [Companilactobacillus paralimentarius]KAE9565231.1 succinyl-diaminopimelate desuccinylase [Companilactobacillus paralimentarius]KRL30430.1 succinyl-diaminopimelate desuccinylase [Companilactobacillus paralimentarius DSM 13238 = JCM 10415]MDR4932920.1 ArgE/DapE family deacylase [Companilactobacillus paralimentarius]QFR69459.1 ArgE/DapE family deacylase [Companilactobacillus paralimentarius]
MKFFTEEQSLDVLKDLVAIKSDNDNELKVASYLKDLLAKYDIESEIKIIRDNRANLVAEIGHGKPVLGISGHMDVVAAGNLDDWNSDPYQLTEKDGQLYGRGATDMKSGLAALIITMIELHHQGLPQKGTIRLMATMGEEVGEEGSGYFLKDGSMDDVDGLVIGEPSGYNIGYAEKGSMDIKFTSKGKASHSSMPEKGFNAIDPLMNLLIDANKTFRDENIKHDSIGPLIFNTTLINGGTQVNSIPDHAEAEINARTIPEYDNQKVIDVLNDLIKKYNDQGAKISFDAYMNEFPVLMDPKNALVAPMKKLMEQYTNEEVHVTPISAVTDASNLVQKKPSDLPFLIAGPGNDTPHQINEHVDKQMYLNFIDIYEKLFIDFLDNTK